MTNHTPVLQAGKSPAEEDEEGEEAGERGGGSGEYPAFLSHSLVGSTANSPPAGNVSSPHGDGMTPFGGSVHRRQSLAASHASGVDTSRFDRAREFDEVTPPTSLDPLTSTEPCATVGMYHAQVPRPRQTSAPLLPSARASFGSTC